MQISIITPFHNTTAELFRKTAESVRKMNFPSAEYEWIIVYHNCAKEYVEQADNIIEELKLSCRTCFLEDDNSTPSAPRNYGIGQATGRYLYFLDSDDLVSEAFLSSAYREAEETGADIVLAGADSETAGDVLLLPMTILVFGEDGRYQIDNKGNCRKDGGNTVKRKNRQILGRLLYGAPVFLATKLIKKELVDRGHIRFSCDVLLIEDILFEAELYAKADLISVLTKTRAYTYIQSEGSQLQRLVRKSSFTPDYILTPVNRILEICDREDIDSNLFLWSIFEMLGALVLKGDIAPEVLGELKKRTGPLADRLRPIEYLGQEGVRKAEAMMAVAGIYIGRPVYELDALQVQLEDLIEGCRGSTEPAVCMEEGSLSYDGLHRISDAIAWKLEEHLTDRKEPVGLYIPKGRLQYAAVFAVLKAGAPLVILSTDLAAERVNLIMEEAGVRTVLAQKSGPEVPGNEDRNIVFCSLDEEGTAPPEYRKISPDSVALIEFTSGSEGVPKGVRFTRRNLLSLVYPFRSNEQMTVQNSLSDCYVMHMGIDFLFGFLCSMETLLNHGMLVVCKTPGEIGHAFVREVLTDKKRQPGLIAVPSTAAQWFKDPELAGLFSRVNSLRYGGEGVREDQVREAVSCLSEGAVLLSGYATTETGPATIRKITPESISCGYPLSDVTISILDEELNCAPTGQRGRICVSGYRVSRGYLNADNNGVFVIGRNGINHFLSNDEGYLTEDGELYMTGRMDRMIKVHGVRVEPSEIEAVMLRFPGISDAAVIRISDEGRDSVCGFYCGDPKIPEETFRSFLAENLPYYMIPDFLVWQDHFELTERGKRNERSFILPKKKKQGKAASGSKECGEVLSVYRQVCGVPELLESDNFFASGGDSLKALKIVAALNERGYSVKVKDIFVYPTVRLLVRAIEKKEPFRKAGEEEKTAAEAVPEIVKAFGTKQVSDWFEAGATVCGYFDMPVSFREAFRYCLRIQYTTSRKMDADFLEERIPLLISNHPSLRTEYVKEDGKVYGIVRREKEPDFYYKDISFLNEEARRTFIQGFWHSLDDADADFSVASLKTGGNQYEVLMRVKHVTADALGSNILLTDLMAKEYCLTGEDDGFLAGQKDLQKRRKDKAAALEFFREYLRDAVPARVSASFGVTQTARGVQRKKLVLDAREFAEIKRVCKENNILFDVYAQYLYGKALREELGLSDVIFLCIFSGRTEKNIHAVGNFISILPVCQRKEESLEKFQKEYLELEEYYYMDADEIGRSLHMPFRALGCAEGINSNLMDAALDPEEAPVSFQVVWEDLKGVRMYPDGEGLVIEMSYYQDEETDRIYQGIAERLDRFLRDKEGVVR